MSWRMAGDHLVGQRSNGHAALDSAADDLVIDVGDVANIGDAVATGLQPTIDDVERHHHARVPHVAQVVDGHAANVHAHMTSLDGLEWFQLTGEGVVDAEAHRCEARTPTRLAPLAAVLAGARCEKRGFRLLPPR
jgi:hypothetical protein